MRFSQSRVSTRRPIDQQPTALVTTTIPSTLEKFFREHLRQLHGAGYRVVVVAAPGGGLDLLVQDLPFISAERLPMVRRIAIGPDVIALLRWIKLMLRVRPAVVIAMTPKASLLAMLAAKLVGIRRRIYSTGGLRLERESGWLLWMLTYIERITCAASSEIVANSPSLSQAYITRRLANPRKLRCTVPGSSHGVDTNHFQPAAVGVTNMADLGLQPDLPVVGFVGRLTADKGIPALVAACEQVNLAIPIQLLVVGPADEPDSMDMNTILGHASFPVVLTGPVSDVRRHLSIMTVNVLPSLREGFPNVVLEAAGMEVPSIVTNATGCVDSVVDGVTGLIVTVGDVRALAQAISSLLSDFALRRSMGRAARQWVVEAFQPTDVVRSSLSIPEHVGATV